MQSICCFGGRLKNYTEGKVEFVCFFHDQPYCIIHLSLLVPRGCLFHLATKSCLQVWYQVVLIQRDPWLHGGPKQAPFYSQEPMDHIQYADTTSYLHPRGHSTGQSLAWLDSKNYLCDFILHVPYLQTGVVKAASIPSCLLAPLWHI